MTKGNGSYMQKVGLTRELLENYKFGLFSIESRYWSRVHRGDIACVTSYGISGWTHYAILGFSVTQYITRPFLGQTIEVTRWEERVEYTQPAESDDDGMLVIHLPWKNLTLFPPTHTTASLESRLQLAAPIGIDH